MECTNGNSRISAFILVGGAQTLEASRTPAWLRGANAGNEACCLSTTITKTSISLKSYRLLNVLLG